MTSALVQFRIDEAEKIKALQICANLGLSLPFYFDIPHRQHGQLYVLVNIESGILHDVFFGLFEFFRINAAICKLAVKPEP